jgi:Tol biopolymer transport system component
MWRVWHWTIIGWTIFVLCYSNPGRSAEMNFGPERRLGNLLDSVTPEQLETVDGVPGFARLTHGTNLVLYPRVRSDKEWSIKASNVQERTIDYTGWTALILSPYEATREYPARKEKKELIVLAPVSTIDFQLADRILFKPKHVGFQDSIANYTDWKVTQRGRQGQSFDKVEWITFSPDGNRLGYAAQKGENWLIVVDGKFEREYSRVDKLVFSKKGQSYAYAGMVADKWHIITNGKPGPGYSDVGWPILNQNGRAVAYAAMEDASWFVVYNGKRGDDHELVKRPVFHPNGKSLVYISVSGGEMSLNHLPDKKQSDTYQTIQWPTFSQDGKVLAFVASDGGEHFMVVNQAKRDQYDAVDWPIFSPSGHALAYRVRQGSKWSLVVEGNLDERFEAVGRPTFSHDGKWVAFPAQLDQKWQVVCRLANSKTGSKKSLEKVSQAYNWVGKLRFSADNIKLGFGAIDGNDIWWKVIKIK